MAAAAKGVDAARAARLRRGRARTLQTAGKVMRYRGALPEAEARLSARDALYQHGGADASSAADGGGSEDEWGAAATLHELGVVSIRRSEWAPAAELLQRSLEMKRRLKRAAAGGGGGGGGVARVHSSGASQVRFSEEAATLHQLAVVATNARPARLEQAEALLRDALALESAGPFALGGPRGDAAAAGARLGAPWRPRGGGGAPRQSPRALHARVWRRRPTRQRGGGAISAGQSCARAARRRRRRRALSTRRPLDAICRSTAVAPTSRSPPTSASAPRSSARARARGGGAAV